MPRDHDRILAVARPRVLLPASGAVWAAAAILHAAHAPTSGTGLVSATAAAVVWGAQSRSAARAHKRAKGKDVPRAFPLTGVTATAGAWLTIASAAGPLAGPYDAMTLVWAGGTLVWLRAITRHDLVRQAKEWRWARHRHLSEAHGLGLGGSHLLEHEPTRLGERKVLDTTGTGKLASQIARSDLAERIAQREGLPRSRVSVTEHRIAGRVAIDTRYRDPWAKPIPHPLFDADPEIDLPVPCTVTEPIPVGQEPDSGEPLCLVLWDETGAKNIHIIAKKRSGKTVLLNCARERITASADARLWNINLSKGVEDREYAPACHRSACGPGARREALAMLRELCAIIDRRGATPREHKIFRPAPAPGDWLEVLIVDESDTLELLGWAGRKAMQHITSKNGSEGVTLIYAGQRGTAEWSGGSNTRANDDYVVLGKVRGQGEVMHAVGGMPLTLPDMSSYGEGRKGVWAVLEVDSGEVTKGRTFDLSELHDIRAVVAARTLPRPHAPEPAGEAAPAGQCPPSAAAAGPDPLAAYEHDFPSVEASLTPGEQDILARLDAKLNRAKEINAESDRIQANLPKVDPSAMAESTRQRWDQAAEQTVIPDDTRHKLLALLTGDGMSGRKVAEAFPDVKRWQVMLWLNRLRWEGLARIEGKGRGARWVRCGSPEAPAGGDSQ